MRFTGLTLACAAIFVTTLAALVAVHGPCVPFDAHSALPWLNCR